MKNTYLSKALFGLSSALSFLAYYILPVEAEEVANWAELKAAREAENIVFTGDITAEGDNYPMPISFNTTIAQTIDGNYHNFSSQDKYSDRWYYYSLSVSKADGSLDFKNFGKFTNGNADNGTFSYTDLEGNTIYKSIEASVNNWKGYFLTINKPIEVNITNSVFADNGKEKDAKLIYVSGSGGGTLNVKDSIFYNNQIANVQGVVSGDRYDTNVENSVFYGNKNATDEGGALYANGIVNVKNSYFINNVAEKDTGGAIGLGGSAVLTVEGSRFEGNSSNDDGGAISGWGSTDIALIKDSQFINNHNGGSYYDGGAISLGGGYIQELDNVLFEGNVACSKGGGVYQGMNGSNTKPAILIKNTIFKNNEASTGGGYYTDGQGRKNYTYVVDSEFTDNIVKATGHYMEFGVPVGGGLLSAGNVPMVVNNTTFTGNIADPEGDYSAGGGLYFAGEFESYPIKIVDSTFTNNSAQEGGAIYIQNADTAIIADKKDVVFSGNTAGADEDDYNGGGDMYFDTSSYAATLSLNAADGKKVVFNGSVAAYNGSSTTATIDINKDGVSYNTYDGTTETAHDAGTGGEIQFNNRVGDENHLFNINLYGGKLSIGQDSTAANPDGLINDNNFTVAGASTLNTANGVIGEFSPVAFAIDSALSYQLDVDLANGTIDKLVGATIGTNGRLDLAVLNIISDADVKNLKLVYSDTNIGGVLKEDYTITTSTTRYEISAENDDTGSYLLISKYIEVTGLPKAIKDAAATYEITADEGEVVAEWAENDLKADLAISGNDKAITTENQLDGINVGSSYTLSMEDVNDVKGFNYAVNNEGVLSLSRSKISDEIINNGTMEINENVTLGEVSGAGVTNVNADFALTNAFSGNTLNVKNATLSGANNLGRDVALNLLGGTLDLANQTVTIKSANFDESSILAVAINSLNDFGTITATDIAVAEGAKLKITLAEDLLAAGESTSLQLLTADNFAVDNFAPEFESEIYSIEKDADHVGAYIITRAKEYSGLPKAIKDAAATYEITADEGEVVAEWAENDLKADLAISGNDKTITTENQLDGINVGSSYTLSMEDVSDVNGFNYAVNNEGVLSLSRSKISDEIINNGTMEINENVTLGEVSGAGVTNVNADFAVAAAFGGNTLNVKNVTLSGANNLGRDVTLNLLGGTLDLANQTVTIKSANFDESSILAVAINSLNDFGTITATDIAVAEGAKLKITLAEDLLAAGESTSLQLLTADNFAVDNFAPEFESEIYSIEKDAEHVGAYIITRAKEYSGLPKAIKDAAATYEITADEGEVVAEWAENDLKADLAISGNDKAITTENHLDGINVGSSYTLSMEDVSDVNGFNYAVNNEGVLSLSRSKISDEIINNGTMEINENVTLGEVSGAGVTNVNADFALTNAFSGNTLNVKNATLSGANNLGRDVALNLLGGTLDLANQTVTIKSANFDESSILAVAINSLNDFGTITATDIAVAEGAKLKITLAEDLLAAGESTSLQLLTADNFAVDNFAPEFESEIYSIEKDAEHVGAYIITRAKEEPDPEPTPDPKPVPAGLSGWVGRADVAWREGQFAADSKAADVARKLTALSQNSAQLAKALKTLAPMQTNTAELVATSHFDRLFRLVEQQQDDASALGMSAGDALQDVRIWGRAYLGRATLDKRGSTHGADFDSQGVVTAIEKKLNPTTRVGGGLQFDRTDIDASNRKIDTSSIYGFAYAKYQPSQWFVDGVISYGKSEYDEKKFALGETFKAKYDVNVASLAAVVGYQFDWFSPEAGLRYYHIKQDSYTDTAQQHVSSINDNLLRAVAGVRVRHTFSKLTAKAYLGLTYDVQRDNDNIHVGLANGSHYVVPEKHLPRLGYEFNLDLTTHVSDNVTVGVGYMGSYRQDYQEHTGMLMLKYNF